IVHLGRRIAEKSRGAMDRKSAIAVLGSGVVGALAYTFSDTFWFSAVEAEVYAMSSLFTAVVFWAILKWEEEADMPYANRWIILIAFLMGISIGVHLLNLLTIPALVFIYYYKKYEVTGKGVVKVLLLSGVILASILYGIIPYLPKAAAYVDLVFVNGMGLPMNVGAVVFVLALIAAGFWGIYYTYRHKKVLLNTIILCATLIVVGYSTFAVVVIRSSANTPTNEYQPDNMFTLVRYIGREQYGSNPLLYGETFASEYNDVKTSQYHNVLDGKYVKVDAPAVPVYPSNQKMVFTRMWQSGAGDNYVPFYQMYTEGKGKNVPGAKYKFPYMKDNLEYFFDYQVDFMYLRYFMWNFVGRQNDLHATVPGDKIKGNWESGVGFIDKMRLGDQSEGPDYIVNSKSKNHYYFLPLILGLLGLFYQLKKDKQNWVVTMLLFILTGIAIVVYLNQPPMQPRERDYAYAGSFYVFTIWIGLAVMWMAELLEKTLKNRQVAGAVAAAACVLVPVQMACENWDDHDRSGRYTARDLAYNYLNTLDSNAVLVTHGDNDTFPLWYIQEVEGVRTDVRIMNTSLLGTDWYIDQMQKRTYESDPVKFSIPRKQYLYGTNDFVQIYDRFNGEAVLGKQVMDIFRNPKIVLPMNDGKNHDYVAAANITIPVNKENVAKYGIVAPEDMDKVEDTIVLKLKNNGYLNKTELMVLDMLCNYQWERPIYFLQMGGDLNIGIKDYLQYDGYAYKFVPFATKVGQGELTSQTDPELYDRIMNTYKWDNFSNADMHVDYQNLLTFNNLCSPRDIMTNCAKWLLAKGEPQKAIEMLDRMQEVMPASIFPLNTSAISSLTERVIMDAVSVYTAAGAPDKAEKLADALVVECEDAIALYGSEYMGNYLSSDDLQRNLYYIYMLADIFEKNGQPELSKKYADKVSLFLQ
ncbi:MAG: DUF2723 domain-containing protein, partial [Bacteroidales bacterium]|nr:DUF2723 domain-containing protein [Bacteroidales bacterium]